MKNFLTLQSMGSDPEYFIVHDYKTYFPPFMFTKGTKDKPEDIPGMPEFSLLTDNLTLEGNIKPGFSKKEFIDNMAKLESVITHKLKKRNCSFVRSDMAIFQNRFLKLEGAIEVGCAPDLNAWIEVYPNTRLRELQDTMSRPERTAGMHIHIGYKFEGVFNDQEDLNRLIAQLFDLFIYIPFYDSTHMYSKRNSMYGIRDGELSGYYRTKPYGLECRALGSSFSEPLYLGYIWDRVEQMFSFIGDDKNMHRLMALAHKLKTARFDDLEQDKLYEIYGIDKEELKLKKSKIKEKIYA